MSQKLEEIEDAASREAFLDSVAHGSAISWQHINLLGEYDFSDEKLRDSVGIRPPKLSGQTGAIFRSSKNGATLMPAGT